MTIEKLKIEIDMLNNKNSNFLKDKEQLLIKFNTLNEDNKKLNNKIKDLNTEISNLAKNIKDNKEKNSCKCVHNLECKHFCRHMSQNYIRTRTTENNNYTLTNSMSSLYNTTRGNNFNNSQNKALTYFYRDNIKYSRNNFNSQKFNLNEDLFNFNYSIYPSMDCRTNRIFKNDKLERKSSYTPKTFELSHVNIDLNKGKEQEKKIINKNKDYELYISSLNNQIFQLEKQIEKLQNKVSELNTLNLSFKKDQNKLKDYEKIIKNERLKTQNAENRISKLMQEIKDLQKSKKNNNYIVKSRSMHNHKKEKIKSDKLKKLSLHYFEERGKTSESENENINRFISDLHKQVDKFNNDLNENQTKNINDIKINKIKNISEESKNYCSDNLNNKFLREDNIFKNSNDISFRVNIENENEFLKKEKININNHNNNRVYTIPEEVNTYTYTIDSRNLDNKKYLYDNEIFDKMKGSDIKQNFGSENYSHSNINENFNFGGSNNNYSTYINNNSNDINIKSKNI